MSELDVSISFLSPQTFRDKLLNVSTTFALPNIDLWIETNSTLLKLKKFLLSKALGLREEGFSILALIL